MLKEVDQKREIDLSKIESRLDAVVAGVEGRLAAAVSEIKVLINGVTLQHNEFRSMMAMRERANCEGSILGSPGTVNGENHLNVGVGQTNRYAIKLDFLDLEGKGWKNGFLRWSSFLFLTKPQK